MNPRPLVSALVLAAASVSAMGESIFKVDFSSGSAGDDVVTAENALPASFPGTELTYVAKVPDVTFKLAEAGALPGKYALLTDAGKSNSSFFLRWAEDAEDKVVSSGVLTVSWTMNFVSGADGDVSLQILRADQVKDAARMARMNISSGGTVKIGGSTQAGAANDFPVAKNFTLNSPHEFVWTLDYATGTQTLTIDGGSVLNYSSTSRTEQNFFGAPAVALKVEVRGNDAVVAFDEFQISTK